MVIAYSAGMLSALAVGALLWWRFGVFPYMEWPMAIAGALVAFFAFRPARGWWTWLLWTVGYGTVTDP